MISVCDLRKKFRGAHGEDLLAVNGIDFKVDEGVFFTLLGPSGCGKTTLLRLIAGLERPDTGEITIDDKVVYSIRLKKFVPVNERDIGMVFQSYAIWPHMTVYENVAFPLQVGKKRFSRQQILERVEKVLVLVRLEGLMDRPAPNLSGGQQQRLALARALVREPKVLLLDEPLSNLDSNLREQLRVELRQIHRELGITTIYVTHDQTEALAMSNLIAVMSEGKIIELGTPRMIYDQPATEFTANFVGSTNQIAGVLSVSTTSEGYRLVSSPIGAIICPVPEDIASGSEVIVLVRPQDVSISRDRIEKQENVFVARIVEQVFLGEHVDCLLEVGGKIIRAYFNPRYNIENHAKLFIHFSPEVCIVIPKE